MTESKKAIDCERYSEGYCVFYSKRGYPVICLSKFRQYFSECKRQGIERGETA